MYSTATTHVEWRLTSAPIASLLCEAAKDGPYEREIAMQVPQYVGRSDFEQPLKRGRKSVSKKMLASRNPFAQTS